MRGWLGGELEQLAKSESAFAAIAEDMVVHAGVAAYTSADSDPCAVSGPQRSDADVLLSPSPVGAPSVAADGGAVARPHAERGVLLRHKWGGSKWGGPAVVSCGELVVQHGRHNNIVGGQRQSPSHQAPAPPGL